MTASAGVALYAARGDVRVGYAALVGLPAVVGALVGTSVQRRLSGGTLTLSFAALLAAVGDLAARRMSTWTIVAALSLGLAAGVLSGVFGVGGGILFVPTLVALGLGQVEAAATSLLAIVPTAATGVIRQRASGNLRLKAALVVGVASIVGAEVGVRIAKAVDEDLLRRAFGVLLLAVAAQLAIRGVRERRRYPDVS